MQASYLEHHIVDTDTSRTKVKQPRVRETKTIEVCNLVARYGNTLAVDGVSFSVGPGEQVTLLGPSGCGKTTVLRCIAGLETPTSGEIWIGGELVFSRELKRNRPTEQRNLSMVFQSYAVWPHMSVFENVAYGLRVRRYSRESIKKRVEEALERLGIAHLRDRPASQLSGGEQQRVALARSIVFDPWALLMDEPMSNLDAWLRLQMRDLVRELRSQLGITVIYVTHDQEEALALSDWILVMRNGRVEQQGTPMEVYRNPRTSFVARFLGSANILGGRLSVRGDRVVFDGAGGVVFEWHASDMLLGDAPVDRPCFVSIPAVYPRLLRPGQEAAATGSSSRHVWPGVVRRRVFLGDKVVYTVEWGAGALEVRTLPQEFFEEGEAVWIAIDPSYINVLDDEL